MDEVVNKSLQQITKGAGLVLLGTAFGMILGFVSRWIIIHYFNGDDYGIYCQAVAVCSIGVTISMLGLSAGIPRQLGFYRGNGNMAKVRGTVFASFPIGIISSAVVSVGLFLASDLLSEQWFHSAELSDPIKVIAVIIPFVVFIRIFVAIFAGFNQVKPSIYFDSLLRNILLIIFVFIFVALGSSFMGLVWAFVASMFFTFIAFAVYLIKKLSLPAQVTTISMRKELLLFSLPLLFVNMATMIVSQLDTMMIGYYMTNEDAGIYNAALPLVQLLPLFLTAIMFLYVPMASGLYAKNQLQEISKTYAILTKWVFSATLPIFLIFVLFPEATLNAIFGSEYIAAADTLQVLAIGFFVSALLGPNGSTLITLGKTRILNWSLLIVVTINVILNIVLIPPLGILGAAIATASALTLRNIIISVSLYLYFRMHPFTMNYLKSALASVCLIAIIYFIIRTLITPVPLWLLPLLFILFIGTYLLSILITRSFDDEDIMMLLTIEKRLGINLTVVKTVMRKFL